MKINVKATELVDGAIEFVSLVKHGANRSPWKIIKAENNTADLWRGLCPELERLEKSLAEPQPVAKETTKVAKIKDVMASMTGEPVQKSDADKVRKLGITKLRHRLAGLYEQQQSLWERPNTPAFQKFDNDLTFAIEKAESELRMLRSDDEQIARSSAFFRRGGTSHYSDATVSDSAYDRRDRELRKAESVIDLSPTVTTTDPEEVSKIDLCSISI